MVIILGYDSFAETRSGSANVRYELIVGDGINVVPAGVYGDVLVPEQFVCTKGVLIGDGGRVGTAVADILLGPLVNFDNTYGPPAVSIFTALPTIASGRGMGTTTSFNATWRTVPAEYVLRFKVVSCATFKRLTIAVYGTISA